MPSRTHDGSVVIQVSLADEDWFVVGEAGVWDLDELEDLARRISSGHDVKLELLRPVMPRRDPSTVQILIDLALGVAAGAAWDATKVAAGTMARRLAGGRPVGPVAPTEAAAVTAARRAIAERYGEDEYALAVATVDVLLDAAAAEVILVGSGGLVYTCWVEIREGFVTTVRVRRTRET